MVDSVHSIPRLYWAVFAYGSVGLLCSSAAIRRIRREVDAKRMGIAALGLFAIAAFYILTEVYYHELRHAARSAGWYADRQGVQLLASIAILGCIGVGAFVAAAVWRPKRQPPVNCVPGTALWLTIVLTLIALLRAVSYHPVDAMLAWRVLGAPIGVLLEAVLLVVISMTAFYDLG